MSTPTIAPVVEPSTSVDSELNHVTCCEDDDIGLCGTDLSQVEWENFDEPSCLVCADLDEVIVRSDSCDRVCPLLRGAA